MTVKTLRIARKMIEEELDLSGVHSFVTTLYMAQLALLIISNFLRVVKIPKVCLV